MRRLVIFLLTAVMIAASVPLAYAEDNSAKIPPIGLEEKVAEWRALNSDTIGWLNIPDTKIDNPVMWHPDDRNQFYFRRNEHKQESFSGCYYADYRCDYSNYALPHVTTIYGHSFGRNGKNAVRFDELRNFLDHDFAKEHPYIYFSDGNKTYTFKIFSIFTTTVDLPYNVPNLEGETRQTVINHAIAESIRNYGCRPSYDARILTLSTAAYSLSDGTELPYPNNYRFVVMAYAIKNPNESTLS